jgi:hypothetical protein
MTMTMPDPSQESELDEAATWHEQWTEALADLAKALNQRDEAAALAAEGALAVADQRERAEIAEARIAKLTEERDLERRRNLLHPGSTEYVTEAEARIQVLTEALERVNRLGGIQGFVSRIDVAAAAALKESGEPD